MFPGADSGHEMRHAKNQVTGEYWDGKTFTGTKGTAKAVDAPELAVLRFTFQNVVDEPMWSVGDKATYTIYTDAEALVVVEYNEKALRVKARQCTKTLMNGRGQPGDPPQLQWASGGFAGHCINQHEQKWDVKEDPNGNVLEFTFREKTREWKLVGVPMKSGGNTLRPGWRPFHDFNF